MQGRPKFVAVVVLRGGTPCALVGRGMLHEHGLLVPVKEGELAANFLNREYGRKTTIYARRHAVSAINRTHKFCGMLSGGSVVDDHSLAKRICEATGDWSIKPLLK